MELHAGKLGVLRGLNTTGGATRNVNFNFDIDKVDVAAMQQLSGPSSGGSAGAKSSSPPMTAKGSVHIGSLSSQGLVLTNIRAGLQLRPRYFDARAHERAGFRRHEQRQHHRRYKGPNDSRHVQAET